MHKKLTVVCVSYKRYKEIHVLINSFLCQTVSNWKLLVIHDGPDNKMRGIVEEYGKNNPEIEYLETEVRYNDWGHSLREIGIGRADTEFVLLTNDDNYYVPKFLECMFEPINNWGADFVLCDMVHNQLNPGQYIQPEYNFFDTYPKKLYIDIGTFIVRTSMAKEVGFGDKSYASDGTFVEDLLNRFPSMDICKIPKILFVHN